jgi:hypothetical protein
VLSSAFRQCLGVENLLLRTDRTFSLLGYALLF